MVEEKFPKENFRVNHEMRDEILVYESIFVKFVFKTSKSHQNFVFEAPKSQILNSSKIGKKCENQANRGLSGSAWLMKMKTQKRVEEHLAKLTKFHRFS